MAINNFKAALLAHCEDKVTFRYSKIKQTIRDIEESLFEESKSSSGDKHHTARAMLQIARENAGRQLFEIEKLQTLLGKIDIRNTSDYARLGSLVHTARTIYFLSISIGPVTIDGLTCVCVALNSPVGIQLNGKREEETFVLNGMVYTIEKIQ